MRIAAMVIAMRRFTKSGLLKIERFIIIGLFMQTYNTFV